MQQQKRTSSPVDVVEKAGPTAERRPASHARMAACAQPIVPGSFSFLCFPSSQARHDEMPAKQIRSKESNEEKSEKNIVQECVVLYRYKRLAGCSISPQSPIPAAGVLGRAGRRKHDTASGAAPSCLQTNGWGETAGSRYRPLFVARTRAPEQKTRAERAKIRLVLQCAMHDAGRSLERQSCSGFSRPGRLAGRTCGGGRAIQSKNVRHCEGKNFHSSSREIAWLG